MRRAAWLLSGCFAVGLILLLDQGCGPVPQGVGVASPEAGMEQPLPGDSQSAGTTTPEGATVPAGTSPTSALQTETEQVPEGLDAALPGTTGTPGSVSGQAVQWGSPASDISGAFAEVRKQLGAMTLYEPGTLPAGSELHHCWWPASSGQEYDAQADSGEPNPRVTGIDASPEVRVLLKVAGGWVEILEGVRGDLGELPNEPAGDVAGHSARSYRLMGGYLVQWSDDGRWYAVYGRGVGLEDVKRVAQGMHPGRI